MEPKLVICGTGRAGTTLLIRILTTAGVQTGFRPRHLRGVEHNVGKAGLETRVSKETADQLPAVVKSPQIVDVLPDLLREKWFEIGLALVPVRDLDDAAKSRKNVQQRASEAGIPSNRAPGGLWKTSEPDDQRWVLAEQFYRTIEPLVQHEVPTTFVSFPRFAIDREYFDRVVAAQLEATFGWDRARLLDAHEKEANSDYITVNQPPS